ncbi:hypothetical protein, partial [Streptomyces flaveolus]
AAEPAEATAEIPAQASQEPEAAEVKPRRTRKAAAVAEAPVEAADAGEAKPKVRRTRKAATAAKQPAESAES